MGRDGGDRASEPYERYPPKLLTLESGGNRPRTARHRTVPGARHL